MGACVIRSDRDPEVSLLDICFALLFRPYAFECACARMQGQLVVCAFIYVLERLVLAVNAVVDRCTFLRLHKNKNGA